MTDSPTAITTPVRFETDRSRLAEVGLFGGDPAADCGVAYFLGDAGPTFGDFGLMTLFGPAQQAIVAMTRIRLE
jgi:hypothetical protein